MMIPLTTLSLALTFWGRYPRIWRWPMTATLLLTGLTWITYATELQSMPVDYGYVGLILIQTFAFSILRLPFATVTLFNLVTIPYYFAFDETFDLGVDRCSPVVDDYPVADNRFTGHLRTVRVDLGDDMCSASAAPSS
jgi:hypothetical protein